MSPRSDQPAAADVASILAGSGEMGERTRAFDWSRTPLGPVQQWPRALQIAVRIMLGSRYAMWLGWGPDFTFFYNDAYARMTLGPKHPWALGRPASEVWPEIWGDVGPRAESVVRTGEATWDEGLLLFLERRGFPEETYHTFSYSPLPDDTGGIGGMLCVVTEDTERTIGERRLRTLRALSDQTVQAKTAGEACAVATATLAASPHDVPFALVYLLDGNGRQATLAGRTRVAQDSPASPAVVDLEHDSAPWPLRQVAETGKAVEVVGLADKFGPLPGGIWPESPQRAVVLPLARPGQSQLAGFIVAGVSPRLEFNDDYRGFLDLLAGQIANAVANARAYEEERRRAEALAELDRAKTAFFSNISHEFRTPLTLILGPLDDAIAETKERWQRDRLELLQRNALRLQKLVNTLLDFSRIEAGRVQVRYQPIDLPEFTQELASNFRSACEKAGLELRVDCPPLGEPVYVDTEMWEKIVLNLLSNAFKFTLQGDINVALRQADRQVELTVRDTGVGIPADQMSKLFERFHRVEGVTGRTQEGSGIGLALVRELVRFHGGEVRATSAAGQGSAFVVSIPLGKDHLAASQILAPRPLNTSALRATHYLEEALRWVPDAESYAEAHWSGAEGEPEGQSEPVPPADRPRVLVADDNADMRHYVARLLARHHDVVAVADGAAALSAARERLPDLILTDVMMPRLDGFGLLKELRADPLTRNVPVIMLSARAGEESRVEGMEAGADDYLVKPFSARELLARIAAHLQMARMRREASAALQQSHARFVALFDAAPLGIYLVDADLRIRQVNPKAWPVFGDIAGLIGSDFVEVIHVLWPREYADEIVNRFRHTLATGEPFFGPEHIQERLDRRVVEYYEWQLHRLALPDGQHGVVCYFSDISRHVLARQALAENEQRLRLAEQSSREILESISDGFFALDRDWRFTYFNSQARRIMEREPGDLLGRVIWDEFPGLIGTDFEQAYRSAARERVTQSFTSYYPDDDRWYEVHVYPAAHGVSIYFRDVSERKRAEAELTRLTQAAEQQRRVYETALSNTVDFNYVFDLRGRFVYVNQALLALWGRELPEAVGKDFHELGYPPELAARLQQQIQTVIETRLPLKGETPYTSAAGERQYEYIFVPVLGTGGTVEAVAGSTRDITERKRADDELRHLAAVLSEADRRKNEFLATLAHELRNPLAPLRNGLQLMRMAEEDAETVAEVRGMMERQLTQLARLVDDLMDVSRINQGKLELRRQPVDLAEVMNSAVETSRPLVAEMGHELSISLPRQRVLVSADLTRLAQVFMNLLNNAAKYSDRHGRIWFTGDRQGNDVVVTVRDQGIGIAADQLPRIFEMFSQVVGSLERSQGGLGIGLSLVKRLVEMHGGTIEARSAGLGQGAEFVVRLPAVASAGLPADAGKGDDKARSALRVLVVDDNRDSADSMALLLKVKGNKTRTAYDGEQAVAAALEFAPDVILLDIGLPKLNGYEACRRIREQPDGREIVIIAQTGWGQDEDRQRTRDAGFDHHLVKPADPVALTQLLANVSRSRQ